MAVVVKKNRHEFKFSFNHLASTLVVVAVISLCIGFGVTGDASKAMLWAGYGLVAVTIGLVVALLPFGGAVLFWERVLPWLKTVLGLSSPQLILVDIVVMIPVAITNIVVTLIVIYLFFYAAAFPWSWAR